MHYSTQTLQKNNVCLYTGANFNIYIKLQDALDNTSSERIYVKDVFINRLYNKKENEAFIITNEFLTNMNIDFEHYNLKDYQIGNTHIIY